MRHPGALMNWRCSRAVGPIRPSRRSHVGLAALAALLAPLALPVASAASSSHARAASASMTVLGPAPAAAPFSVELTLAPRRPAALARLVTAVTTPGSSRYRHFLSRGVFAARFGASSTEVRAAEASLVRAGLPGGVLNADRLSMTVHTDVATLERALHADVVKVRVAGHVVLGTLGTPSLPRTFAPAFTGAVGLDVRSAEVPESLVRSDAPRVTPRLTANVGPTPNTSCQAAITKNGGGYTPDDIAAGYDMSGLYAAGDLGAGSPVGLIEFATFSTADVDAYAACFGLTPRIRVVPVDGGPGNADASSVVEAELDIEDVVGLAPEAPLVVYEGANQAGAVSNASAYDAYAQAINEDRVKVITTSWGTCEGAIDAKGLAAERLLFEQAALQGQTVIAASGDSGAEDCRGTLAGAAGAALAVDDPASQAFVTAVGGTTLQLTPSRTEVVWNTGASGLNAGAGGGGLSGHWVMPVYQREASVALGVRAAGAGACALRRGCRSVPDVSMDAGTPYAIYCTAGFQLCGRTGWTALGGTSAAAPSFAALIALADSSSACASSLGSHASLGFVNPALYAIADVNYGGAFNDIVAGDNDLTGQSGGRWGAGPGYDLASGLGSPIAGNGADTALVASLCNASVQSASLAESGLPRPSLAAIAPRQGSTSGGEAVRLDGAALAGAEAVHFGATPARSFKIVSNSEILAVAPPGGGHVHVVVTTRAGSSKNVRGNVFTYVALPVISRLAPPVGSSVRPTTVVLIGRNLLRATAVLVGARRVPFTRRASGRLVATVPPGHGLTEVVVRSGAGSSAPVPFRFS